MRSSEAGRRRNVYLSLAAQSDNLGDIVIRQVMVDFVSAPARKLVVFVGDMPDAYVAAFDLPEGTQLVTSTKRFARLFLVSLARRRADLVFAPGPFVVRGGAGLLKGLAGLAGIAATRACGGSVISVGRAVRGTNRPALAIQRRALRVSSLFIARDRLTSDVLGTPVRDAPDLALADVRLDQRADPRPYVVLSFRGDREPSAALLEDVVSQSRQNGLTPIIVTQVQRDDLQHGHIAERLGIELCDWSSRSHTEQLARIRRVYSAAHTVVSDRLHAIAMGVQYGALPVVVAAPGPDKVVTTLGHVVPLRVQGSDGSRLSFPLLAEDNDALQGILNKSVLDAQEELLEVRRDVAMVLGSGFDEQMVREGNDV